MKHSEKHECVDMGRYEIIRRLACVRCSASGDVAKYGNRRFFNDFDFLTPSSTCKPCVTISRQPNACGSKEARSPLSRFPSGGKPGRAGSPHAAKKRAAPPTRGLRPLVHPPFRLCKNCKKCSPCARHKVFTMYRYLQALLPALVLVEVQASWHGPTA